MGNRFRRQEEMKIRKTVAAENIRRVFFASLVCAVILPVYILINKKVGVEGASIVNGALTAFEIIYLIGAGIAFIAIRNNDTHMSVLMYRTFWIVLEITSFIAIYSSMHDGAGLTLYAAMLAAVMLVPIMSLNEQMYYIMLEAVFVIFLEIKFKGSGISIYNLIILNGLFFALSRVLYKQHCENIAYKERLSEKNDNEGNDELTGLLNHRGLEKRTFDLTRECIRDKRRLSVLMIDFDDLQCYNDTFGAERADDCIRTIADLILQVSLRNTDLICRLYGGKFLLCMQGGDDMEPVRLAEKIRTVIEQKRIPQGRRASGQFVTVSIGAASCIPKTEKDYAETYDEAEEAMYCAKDQGRNVTVYEEQIFGAYKRAAL